MADTCNVVEEFNDAERARLVEEIGNAFGLRYFNSAAFFFLWLSDKEVLRDIRSHVDDASYAVAAKPTYKPTSLDLREVARTWIKPRMRKNSALKAVKRKANDSPRQSVAVAAAADDDDDDDDYAEQGLVPTKKNPALVDICLKRDGRRCIVTHGVDAVESCHIYPFALAKRRGTAAHQDSFWDMLKIFWKHEEVNHWQKTVEGTRATEFVENLLSLWSGVHDFWERGLFAFKPIKKWAGPGNKEYLLLHFFWMPGAFSKGPVPIAARPSLSGGLESTWNGTRLWHNEREEKILSGQEIFLETENKLTHPLPSFELLKMQWALHLVASLSGAAEDPDDEDDEDEPGEVAEAVYIPETVEAPETPKTPVASPSRGILARSPDRVRKSARSRIPHFASRPDPKHGHFSGLIHSREFSSSPPEPLFELIGPGQILPSPDRHLRTGNSPSRKSTPKGTERGSFPFRPKEERRRSPSK